ncbi:MAG: AAA family ATPase, partial [Desulfovibrionales bacterium]
DGQLDPHLINHLESKFKDSRFVRVDSDVVDKLIEKEDKKEVDLSGEEQTQLRSVFEGATGNPSKYWVQFEPGVDLEEVKKWYNGYSWLGEKVYNPFDVLLYLRNKEFSNYWFESGTPTFLIKLLQSRKYSVPEINDLKAGEKLLGSFDIDFIEVENLLFQTGYLTIKGLEKMT